jgi:hypothetical protein
MMANLHPFVGGGSGPKTSLNLTKSSHPRPKITSCVWRKICSAYRDIF